MKTKIFTSLILGIMLLSFQLSRAQKFFIMVILSHQMLFIRIVVNTHHLISGIPSRI